MGDWSYIDQDEAGKGNRLLTIRLNDRIFALPIDCIKQIIPISTKSTGTSRAGDGPVIGFMSLRGKAIPLIDLRRLLGLQGKNRMHYAPVIICRVKGQTAGLLVDSVLTVASMAAYQVTNYGDKLPEDNSSADYIQGKTCSGEHPILLLNLEFLFQDLPYELPLKLPSAGMVLPGLEKV